MQLCRYISVRQRGGDNKFLGPATSDRPTNVGPHMLQTVLKIIKKM